MKPYPSGTYCLLNSNTGLSPEVLALPYIKGFRIRTDWQHVQPRLGEPNWIYIEETLRLARDNKKRCGLSIAAGIFAPVELFDEQGADEFPLDEVSGKGGNEFMAMPWDDILQRDWSLLVGEAGERYDEVSAVSYVVISGFMQIFENHFVVTDSEMARAEQVAKSCGFTNFSEGYLQGAKQIIQLYAAAFPNTPLILAYGGIGPGQKQTEKELFEWAKETYPGHVGTMTAYLKAIAPPHAPNDNPPLGFPKGDQAVYGSYDQTRFYGDNPPEPFPAAPQPVDDLLATAVAKDDMFVEIYEGDAKDSANAEVIAARNRELEQNATK